MLRSIGMALLVLSSWTLFTPTAAFASRCLAYVDNGAKIIPASFPVARAEEEVKITYVDHSTFRVQTPAGVTIATDYAGYSGTGPLPRVVTMNHAHETHYTDFPDPKIQYVLRGWNPKGGPAKHNLQVDDVLIRNVSTDIRGWGGGVEPFGNSIFIFEVADLCIGHFGHLHHKPTPEQLAQIGRLDVVFAPVDGSYTLDIESMIEVLKELKASLVIPMHYFGEYTLARFLEGMKISFDIKVRGSASTVVSLETLPKQPTVLVLAAGY